MIYQHFISILDNNLNQDYFYGAYFDITYLPEYKDRKNNILAYVGLHGGQLLCNTINVTGYVDNNRILSYIDTHYKDLVFAEYEDGSGKDLTLKEV